MFSYFGSKSRFIRCYDPPRHGLIIEPFAGSARYACLYHDCDVWINDSYEVVYRMWKFIQQMTRKDIDRLPDLKEGERISDLKGLCDEERWLLGFCTKGGATEPVDRCNRWGEGSHYARSLRSRLKTYVGRIKHWKITNLDYRDMENLEGTWFIDPPYQVMGNKYVHGSIDYPSLLEWIKMRKGDTITCENSQSTWLDRWDPLILFRGQAQKRLEVVRYSYRQRVPLFDRQQCVRSLERAKSC